MPKYAETGGIGQIQHKDEPFNMLDLCVNKMIEGFSSKHYT